MEHDANQGGLDHDLDEDFEGDLSEQHRARIKAELGPGERLLWSSRADPDSEPPRFGSYIAEMIAVIFLAGGLLAFANAWGYLGRPATDGSSFVAGCLFSILGCLIGWFLIAGVWARRNERIRMVNTLYAVTNRRALIWTPVGRSESFNVVSMVLTRLEYVSRLEHPDGGGDVFFGAGGRREDFYEECGWDPVGFRHVPNVRQVERIIRRNLLNPDPTRDA